MAIIKSIINELIDIISIMLTFILLLIGLFTQANSFASIVEGFYWDQQK